MGEKTGIEWTDATWNPWIGCSKVSPGCDSCYMFAGMRRYGHNPETVQRTKDPTFYAPLRWKESKRIFTCSWSDFFHKQADSWWEEAWDVIQRTPQHIYQILTKRPGIMVHWAKTHIWPPNVWAGTSVESQKYAPRLTLLAQVPARVRFVSYEPALEAVDLRPWLGLSVGGESASLPPVLSWVIAGGESGPNARPTHPDWFRSIRDQCQAAGVPFFFKQWGQYRPVFDEPLPVKTRVVMVNPSGSIGLYAQSTIDPRYHLMASVGKNAAGALLDGQEWRGMPER